MTEPTNLMIKQSARLFPDSETEQAAFLDSLLHPPKTKQPAVIWTRPEFKKQADLPTLPAEQIPDWLPEEVSFLSPDVVPGKSEWFEKGAIYPVDTSSIHTASALLGASTVRRALDVCAAPGGKSLFTSTILKPDFILANEVIGKRLGMLCHNLKRSGRPGLYTQSLDPAELSVTGKSVFDLVIVDAPCSGQSLLAKGKDNPGCFHPNIVKGNAKRQLRILSQSSECVVDGGWLFYSTCTFAIRENETVIEKFLNKHSDFSTVVIPHLQPFQSPLSDYPCYRIYPHRQNGAGGFTCLLKRSGNCVSLPEIPDVFLDYPVEI